MFSQVQGLYRLYDACTYEASICKPKYASQHGFFKTTGMMYWQLEMAETEN